ncbi:MAG: MupG family TIM beta-alpha barrel fold protein, partial [Megasphaera sp.]|nr:MupG family TIM beta-alpha barrel fold protein [Megasphaera sp.]
MDTGISIYPGLGGSITEKTDRIDAASALGIRRLFTSFHIPETDASAFHKELDAVLSTARSHGFDVVADISPASAALLGMDRFEPVKLANLGITTIRIDDGFDAEKIALYSQVIQVQLNASTLTEDNLKDLQKRGA